MSPCLKHLVTASNLSTTLKEQIFVKLVSHGRDVYEVSRASATDRGLIFTLAQTRLPLWYPCHYILIHLFLRLRLAKVIQGIHFSFIWMINGFLGSLVSWSVYLAHPNCTNVLDRQAQKCKGESRGISRYGDPCGRLMSRIGRLSKKNWSMRMLMTFCSVIFVFSTNSVVIIKLQSFKARMLIAKGITRSKTTKLSQTQILSLSKPFTNFTLA